MSEKIDYHIQRLGQLKADRSEFDQQWEEAASMLMPAHRNTFFGTDVTNRRQGSKQSELQFDATGAMACSRFASVVESLGTPQNSLWHYLRPTDKALMKNRTVREWFDTLRDVLFGYRYRPAANFVGNSQQIYFGLGAYGNGVMFVDQPEDGVGLRYRSIHIGEAYFVENHAGMVDTVYRSFHLTTRQLIELFENVPDHIREQAKDSKQIDNKHAVLHCVYPRSDYDPQRRDSLGMKYASLYILEQTKDVLREGGYSSFPYPVSRYTQMPGEVYGRGPAQMVLPAMKTLNQEKKTVLKQGNRITDPVLLAHDDGQLSGFSLRAGAMNFGGVSADGKPLVHVLPTGNIAVGEKMMDIEKGIINDAFLVTLFQILVDSPQMTATEVLERAREKGMLLAPTAGRMQSEYLGPLIEREIDVLSRQGLLPPMPAILQQAQAEYTIEYDSPMSRMQRAERASGFMRALGQTAEYAKLTGDMDPLDYFNFDVATPEILDIQGSPISWTRSREEVEQRRQARAQAAQQQQMVDAAPALASVGKTLAPSGGQ
jgi:hypothetical protein